MTVPLVRKKVLLPVSNVSVMLFVTEDAVSKVYCIIVPFAVSEI